MSDPAIETSLWTPRRWILVIVILVAVQLLAIWHNSEQPQPTRKRIPRPAVTSLVVDADAEAGAWLALNDPTLFSMASPNNFSGRAWLNDHGMAHPWKEWAETQGGQVLNPADLGQILARTFGKRPEMSDVVVEKPEAPLAIVVVDGGPVLTQSVMRIEGELARLKLERAGDLPGWTNTETLESTTVEMGVGRDGLPFSVRLLDRCGLAAADQYAVTAARSLRFAPIGESGASPPTLVWGNVMFQWQTLMAEMTNGTPVKR